MHPVEAFTDELWICTQCGNLFARWPRCAGCVDDPLMQNHECYATEALIEGDCEPDPILIGGNE